MGVLYTVVPLEGEVRAWLVDQDVDAPTDQDGRPATPRELIATANSLDGVDAQLTGDPTTQIFLSGESREDLWTLVNLTDPQGPDRPVEFWFEKGSPELIVRFLAALASMTGPLVLIADTGDKPTVISARVEASVVLEAWEHTSS